MQFCAMAETSGSRFSMNSAVHGCLRAFGHTPDAKPSLKLFNPGAYEDRLIRFPCHREDRCGHALLRGLYLGTELQQITDALQRAQPERVLKSKESHSYLGKVAARALTKRGGQVCHS